MKIDDLQKILINNPIYNACSDQCDNVNGPCACGAWHSPEEIKNRIEKDYNIHLDQLI